MPRQSNSAAGFVYVDMDDVLCQTVRTLVEVLDERFGRRVALEDIQHFELTLSFGLGEAEWEEMMRIAHQPRWLESMLPVAGARDALHRWTGAGCDVAVVTGRPPSAADPSRRWLHSHAMPHASLDFVDKYGRTDWADDSSKEGQRARSLDEITEMGFTLAVEDSRDMAIFLAQEVGVPVALIDQPWNREPISRAQGGDRIVRCTGWSEVMERFPDPADPRLSG